jgi:hypothetical protein
LTISEAINTYLLAQGDLTAIIGQNLYPERADQDAAVPYITYHIELRDAEPTQSDPTLMVEASIGFVCVSNGYDQAFELAELLRTLLQVFKGIMGGTSGLQIESATWEETLGGYLETEAANAGVFGTMTRFTIQYIPQ